MRRPLHNKAIRGRGRLPGSRDRHCQAQHPSFDKLARKPQTQTTASTTCSLREPNKTEGLVQLKRPPSGVLGAVVAVAARGAAVHTVAAGAEIGDSR
eukprot:scaffold2846_cov125-Isochrysis_galbana.AAC.2